MYKHCKLWWSLPLFSIAPSCSITRLKMKLFIPPLGDFEDPLSSPLKQGWSAHTMITHSNFSQWKLYTEKDILLELDVFLYFPSKFKGPENSKKND